jgi:hypothetical protein
MQRPECALFYVIVEVEETVQFGKKKYNAVLAQTNDST